MQCDDPRCRNPASSHSHRRPRRHAQAEPASHGTPAEGAPRLDLENPLEARLERVDGLLDPLIDSFISLEHAILEEYVDGTGTNRPHVSTRDLALGHAKAAGTTRAQKARSDAARTNTKSQCERGVQRDA